MIPPKKINGIKEGRQNHPLYCKLLQKVDFKVQNLTIQIRIETMKKTTLQLR